MEPVKFVIITGLSGAGKSEAMRSFEDLGYFCVDNLPPALIPKFAELCAKSAGQLRHVALVSDIRGGQFFDRLFDALADLEQFGFEYTILFLEAADEALIRRFKATRRRHPLDPEGNILDAIAEERRRLQELRGRAHRILDTTAMTPRELKETIVRLYSRDEGEGLSVTVISFGFKHGVPVDSDLVFDVRFLPNPHWVEDLACQTGKDPAVEEYVFKWPVAQRFMEKLYDLMDFLMPQYTKETKSHLVIGIGCTGGRHRSVAVARRLGEFLRSRGFRVAVQHRDLDE
ncbi:MAG: RNase adapter RapZ [Firmicutes bacterium]|nr:RNase adapter RapZ [Bacillota bacterium]